MKYANFHTHSTYSDGKHTLEENVVSAIDKNMTALGFSDHSFTSCDTSYCMKQERFAEYCSEIQMLKEKYADRIKIFCGLELDYYTTMDTDGLDYVIASIHYINHGDVCYPIDHSPEQQMECINDMFGGDPIAMAAHYYNQLAEHVEHYKPTFVGHFDVITKFGQVPEDDAHYREIARNAMKRILKTCNYFEVNSGAIARGWKQLPYPNRFLLETLLEEDGEVVLSSDSHHQENLGYFFDESVNILKEVGFDHVNVFNGTGFDKVYFD